MFYVILKGHDYEYEIGELIKAFGLRRRIEFLYDDTDISMESNSFLLINEIKSEDNNYNLLSILFRGSNEIAHKKLYFKLEAKDEIEARKILKRKIKLNIYDTLKDGLTYSLPWGTLTGIRPTKIVHEYLDKGLSIEDIKVLLERNYRLEKEKINLLIDIAATERKYINTDKNLCSIYISIPYCPSRCVYCSFPSNPLRNHNIDEYLEALSREIDGVSELLDKLKVGIENIYIGGGTPTTLSPSQLDRLISHVKEKFDISKLKEFTIEAGRPDTIDREKLIVMKKNDIDRISINPQTMNEKTLKLIGRNHTVEDIYRVYYLAKEIGFKTINMDVIVGLPEEGIKEITNTLEEISKLNPENLTVHTLAIKRSSKLKESQEEYDITNEKMAIKMLDITRNYADKMNLYPYYMYRQKYMVGNLENVGYSKIGHECIYNIQIMEERQSIIALGAGGISKILYPNENRLERVPNVKNVKEYIERVNEMIERKRIELFS